MLSTNFLNDRNNRRFSCRKIGKRKSYAVRYWYTGADIIKFLGNTFTLDKTFSKRSLFSVINLLRPNLSKYDNSKSNIIFVKWFYCGSNSASHVPKKPNGCFPDTWCSQIAQFFPPDVDWGSFSKFYCRGDLPLSIGQINRSLFGDGNRTNCSIRTSKYGRYWEWGHQL